VRFSLASALFVVLWFTTLQGPDGLTPLMVAASAGSVQALKALIEAGADANATHGFAGQTALHMAAELDQVLQ